MDASTKAQFNVGGLLLDQPFKIRRLGHFGLDVDNMPECIRFYCDLLGFHVSDAIDFAARAEPGQLDGVDHTKGVFTRHNTDHHSFVLFPRQARKRMDRFGEMRDGRTIQQITWQVGALDEVVRAYNWFKEIGIPIRRTGRDMPGSNWHTYQYDPDGHNIELYYGMEQIGWDGLSKPRSMYTRKLGGETKLPQISEYEEVMQAMEESLDLTAGVRQEDRREAEYAVGGVLLPRPFRITRIGPVRLFVADMTAALQFYRDSLGFIETEVVDYDGHACHFLRNSTEHHSLALYPAALRAALGLREDTTLMSFGLQLGDYAQLRAAVGFLADNGVEIRHLPQELFPGIDYTAFAIDPDGHAIQLYDYMEQIGWDGKPRPAGQRRRIDNGNWPEALTPASDSLMGEPFLGPLG